MLTRNSQLTRESALADGNCAYNSFAIQFIHQFAFLKKEVKKHGEALDKIAPGYHMLLSQWNKIHPKNTFKTAAELITHLETTAKSKGSAAMQRLLAPIFRIMAQDKWIEKEKLMFSTKMSLKERLVNLSTSLFTDPELLERIRVANAISFSARLELYINHRLYEGLRKRHQSKFFKESISESGKRSIITNPDAIENTEDLFWFSFMLLQENADHSQKYSRVSSFRKKVDSTLLQCLEQNSAAPFVELIRTAALHLQLPKDILNALKNIDKMKLNVSISNSVKEKSLAPLCEEISATRRCSTSAAKIEAALKKMGIEKILAEAVEKNEPKSVLAFLTTLKDNAGMPENFGQTLIQINQMFTEKRFCKKGTVAKTKKFNVHDITEAPFDIPDREGYLKELRYNQSSVEQQIDKLISQGELVTETLPKIFKDPETYYNSSWQSALASFRGHKLNSPSEWKKLSGIDKAAWVERAYSLIESRFNQLNFIYQSILRGTEFEFDETFKIPALQKILWELDQTMPEIIYKKTIQQSLSDEETRAEILKAFKPEKETLEGDELVKKILEAVKLLKRVDELQSDPYRSLQEETELAAHKTEMSRLLVGTPKALTSLKEKCTDAHHKQKFNYFDLESMLPMHSKDMNVFWQGEQNLERIWLSKGIDAYFNQLKKPARGGADRVRWGGDVELHMLTELFNANTSIQDSIQHIVASREATFYFHNPGGHFYALYDPSISTIIDKSKKKDAASSLSASDKFSALSFFDFHETGGPFSSPKKSASEEEQPGLKDEDEGDELDLTAMFKRLENSQLTGSSASSDGALGFDISEYAQMHDPSFAPAVSSSGATLSSLSIGEEISPPPPYIGDGFCDDDKFALPSAFHPRDEDDEELQRIIQLSIREAEEAERKRKEKEREKAKALEEEPAFVYLPLAGNESESPKPTTSPITSKVTAASHEDTDDVQTTALSVWSKEDEEGFGCFEEDEDDYDNLTYHSLEGVKSLVPTKSSLLDDDIDEPELGSDVHHSFRLPRQLRSEPLPKELFRGCVMVTALSFQLQHQNLSKRSDAGKSEITLLPLVQQILSGLDYDNAERVLRGAHQKLRKHRFFSREQLLCPPLKRPRIEEVTEDTSSFSK